MSVNEASKIEYAIAAKASARAVKRGLQTLYGTLAGIATDYVVTDSELTEFRKWLDYHVNLRGVEPFGEVHRRIEGILEDGVVSQDEREELLEWISDFLEGRCVGFFEIDEASQRLQGFLQGIGIDNIVSDREIRDLKDWLLDYEFYRSAWPFADVWSLLESILSDGRIEETERLLVQTFCKEFSEEFVPAPKDNSDMARFAGGSPTLRSIKYILDTDCKVVVENKNFCITGTSLIYKRKEWHELIVSRGGCVRDSLVKDLDYLVLCNVSTPAWMFSTYGRKVEEAVRRRNERRAPLIISEEMLIASF